MKRNCAFVLMALYVAVSVSQETIDISETFPTVAQDMHVSAYPEVRRMSKENAGVFNVSFGNCTEQQKAVVQEAFKLWEEAICIDQKIEVFVSFDYYSSMNLYNVETVHCPSTLDFDLQEGAEYICAALYRQYNVGGLVGSEYDFKIKFNSEDIWDYNTDPLYEIEEGKYDLVTVALRAIAKGLGFKTALRRQRTGVGFFYELPNYYIYDACVRNGDGKMLIEYSSGDSELANFLIHNAYWARKNYLDYKLYTPAAFDPNSSLCYFDEEAYDDSTKMLMAPEANGRIYHIGEKVLDIMRDIGWSNGDLEIACDSIPNSGVIRSIPGKQYTFKIVDNIISAPLPGQYVRPELGKYEWSFDIIEKDGTFRNISSLSGSFKQFTVSLPEEYFDTDERTYGGSIKAVVRVIRKTNSSALSKGVFALAINLKPEKPLLQILEVCRQDLLRRKIKIGFRTYGANSYNISVLNKRSYIRSTIGVYRTGYIEYELSDLYNDTDYEISVYGVNQYGLSEESKVLFAKEDSKSIKITSFVNHNKLCLCFKDSCDLPFPVNVSRVEIYDIYGNIKMVFNDANEMDVAILPQGVYIIIVHDYKANNVYSYKFIN